MRISRIYLPLPLEVGQSIELDPRSFHYVINVLRLEKNSELILFNGKGHEFFGLIEKISKKTAFVKIEKKIDTYHNKTNLSIHLGLSISKGDRMDYAIQKSVELGVSEITPLFTSFCNVNLDEKRKQKRMAHWQAIIIGACEQCGRTVIPELNQIKNLTEWADTINEVCIILDPRAEKSLKSISPDNDAISLVIGPEGGLSEKEISGLEMKKNFHPIKFGSRILRTETAAIAAITAIQVLWGDLTK